jgi:hypothetical protein
MALLDSCHSGTGLDLPFTWQPRQGGWREETNPYHSLGDVQMISGCEVGPRKLLLATSSSA